MIAPIVNVNEVPAVRAVTTGFSKVDSVVLQVTLSFVPKLSSTVKLIWLFAVTALVFTTSVGFVPVGSATLPAAADAHTAGEAELEQLVVVPSVVPMSVVKAPVAGVVLPILAGAAQVLPTSVTAFWPSADTQ